MSNVKKYVLTAVTLGVIAMASGVLIGATNIITAEKIKQNEENKINNGIKEVFDADEKAVVFDKGDVTGYKYVTHCYGIQAEKDVPSYMGIAFLTSGSNMYGKISLIIGFGLNQELKGVSIVVNEQTYASTLVENYIDPLNGTPDTYDIDKVNCGATYGATLVKDMINEAKEAFPSFII